MRFLCRCGNMLTNQLDPNDTEYYVYSDREWSEFEKKGRIYSVSYTHLRAHET